MPHGKLIVVVDGATNIKSSGVYGMGSSYCTLSCGSQVFNSPTIEGGGSHPRFNTAFEFEIDRTTNDLDVCVYSKSSTRDEDLVGYCKLDFKTVFFKGHTVPLTAFPLQQPSGNSGGKINLSLKFKMRPSPNKNNTHVPIRCSSETPRVVNQVVGRQTVSVEWGCEEKDYIRTQPDQPRHREEYLNVPGTAPNNFPETAPEPPLSFVRLNTPKLRNPSPTPKQPIPAKPQNNQTVPNKPKPHVFVQSPTVPPRQNYGYDLAQEAVQGFGEQVAEHLMAEAGNQIMAAVGNQVMTQGGYPFMAEAGNQVMTQGVYPSMAEAVNQVMAQGGYPFMAEAGNQVMTQGVYPIMGEAGNQFMAEAGNQFMAEAGNQLIAQAGNQFFAGLLGLGFS